MLDFGHGRVVHSAGLLLPVTADKGYCIAIGEHICAILHLPDLRSDGGGYLF